MVGILDSQLFLMQGWAWITMLNDRIPEQGIEQAIATTFSGDSPCDKCISISAIKEKQKETPEPKHIKSGNKLVIGYLPHSPQSYSLPILSRLSFEAIHFQTLYSINISDPGPPPRKV